MYDATPLVSRRMETRPQSLRGGTSLRNSKKGMCMMFLKLGISLVCFLVSLGNACDSKSRAGEQPAPDDASQAAATTKSAELKGEANSEAGSASSAAALDACTLIEKSEIASVQGVEVQQMQPTSQKHGELNISQCYYTVISADGSKNLSVYLQVIQRDPKSSKRDALKEFWEERFEREGKEKTEAKREAKREEREEEEEEINPPLPVSSVGDEAFWLGTSRGGALFVLKKDKVLRVTVGGTDDVKAQIEKSKTLAKKALARLM